MSQAVQFVIAWFFLGIIVPGLGWIAFPALYWLLAIWGSDARAAKAQQKLHGTLMKDEKIVTTAFQKRIAALVKRRQLVAITSSRIITLSRSWFGGFTMRDYQWKDLHDARLRENMFSDTFGSKLTFMVGADKPQLSINGIPNEVASQIYSHAQGEEQAWEEKRRVRSLEEIRAASGGITIGSGMPQGMSSGGGVSVVDELGKAKAFLTPESSVMQSIMKLKRKFLAGRRDRVADSRGRAYLVIYSS